MKSNKFIFFILLAFVSCTSRSERIDRRLIVLNNIRDSLNIQYRMLEIVNDSLRHLSANLRSKNGKPDSLTEVKFFENERRIEKVLMEANTVSGQIKELELVK